MHLIKELLARVNIGVLARSLSDTYFDFKSTDCTFLYSAVLHLPRTVLFKKKFNT